MTHMVFLGVAGGSWILLLVMVLMLAGVIIGFYTRRGSGIASHPTDGRGEAPGAKGRGEASGKDEGEGSNLDDHGGA